MKKKTKRKIALLQAANSDVRRIADQRNAYQYALMIILDAKDHEYLKIRTIAIDALKKQGITFL